VLQSYAHEAANISPLLLLMSPVKRCGKSTVLLLLQMLVRRPFLALKATAAVIYRVIDARCPTLLLDEADQYMKSDSAIAAVLNGGHNRHTAKVVICDGDNHEPREFSAWGPKAIASIKPLDDTTMDRSIVIPMRRRLKGEQVARFRADRPAIFAPLRRQCRRWADDNLVVLRDVDPEPPDWLNDRAADNWRTLLAIAVVAGWRDDAEEALAALVPQKADDDEDYGVSALRDVKVVFTRRGATVLASTFIMRELNDLPESPWADWNRGNGLSQKALANLLRPFGVRPDRVEPTTGDATGKRVRGYKRAWFEDAWARYLHEQGDSVCGEGGE
jgi:hypothetical protein